MSGLNYLITSPLVAEEGLKLHERTVLTGGNSNVEDFVFCDNPFASGKRYKSRQLDNYYCVQRWYAMNYRIHDQFYH